MSRNVLTLIAALLLAGCSSQIQLPKDPHAKAPRITVVNKRSPTQLARKHDALFSAVVFLEDAKFAPRAVDIYATELSTLVGADQQSTLEITEFRVADFYPVRLGAGGQGLLGAAVFHSLIDKNTDWAFISELGLNRNKDAVICIVIGKINGAEIKVATSEAYKASPFAGLVYNDPDFQRALDAAIKHAARESAKQSRLGAR